MSRAGAVEVFVVPLDFCEDGSRPDQCDASSSNGRCDVCRVEKDVAVEIPIESALTPNPTAYWRRVQATQQGEPSCRLRWCVLPPNHAGTLHEGPDFDVWGPKYRQWEER